MNRLDQFEKQVEAVEQAIVKLEKQLEDNRWRLLEASREYDSAVVSGDERGKREFGRQYEEEEKKMRELKPRLNAANESLKQMRIDHFLMYVERITAPE